MELLKQLSETPGISGYETEIRALIREHMQPLCNELRTDALGNLIGLRKARGVTGDRPLRVMVSGHMDEIGFIVSHVDEKTGFLRFSPVGGFDPSTVIARRVTVHAQRGPLAGVVGSKPIHIMTDEEKKKKPELKDLYIDLGLPAEKVNEEVEIGDMITRDQTFSDVGETVVGKALDDRLGVYVMLEALRKLGDDEAQVDIYAVASVQEEVGLRGAITSAYGIEPDLGVALDVTMAGDIPDSKPHEQVCKLGGGAAIKIKDASVICDRTLVAHLRKLAKEREIKHQLEILNMGGTDTGAIQRSRAGCRACALSVATRYVHSTVEMAHKEDIQATIDLLAAFLQTAHEID